MVCGFANIYSFENKLMPLFNLDIPAHYVDIMWSEKSTSSITMYNSLIVSPLQFCGIRISFGWRRIQKQAFSIPWDNHHGYYILLLIGQTKNIKHPTRKWNLDCHVSQIYLLSEKLNSLRLKLSHQSDSLHTDSSTFDKKCFVRGQSIVGKQCINNVCVFAIGIDYLLDLKCPISLTNFA